MARAFQCRRAAPSLKPFQPFFPDPMKTVFLNSSEDVTWLRQTHLAPKSCADSPLPVFASFFLHGNEDCPAKLELYRESEPTINARRASVYVLVDSPEKGFQYVRERCK